MSERKLSDRALKASEQNFRAIFDGVMEGILVVDPAGPRLLAANRTILEMFGYAAGSDLSSIDLLWHFPHAAEERLMEHLTHAWSPGSTSASGSGRNALTGVLLWIEAIAHKSISRGGWPLSWPSAM